MIDAEPSAHPPTSSTRTAPRPFTGLVYFDPHEAAIVAAAVARLIPTDEHGPGAAEADVLRFIDRQLATGTAFRGKRYGLGPFLPGRSTQGDQSDLDVRGRFRLGIAAMEACARVLYQTSFASLAPEHQDRILGDMEVGIRAVDDDPAIQAFPPGQPDANEADAGAKAFFEILLAYTQAGYFADPIHGGNRDMVGWKLIGFPGAPMGGYAAAIELHGEPWVGEPTSLADVQARAESGAER